MGVLPAVAAAERGGRMARARMEVMQPTAMGAVGAAAMEARRARMVRHRLGVLVVPGSLVAGARARRAVRRVHRGLRDKQLEGVVDSIQRIWPGAPGAVTPSLGAETMAQVAVVVGRQARVRMAREPHSAVG